MYSGQKIPEIEIYPCKCQAHFLDLMGGQDAKGLI